jgi:hypothetical protein
MVSADKKDLFQEKAINKVNYSMLFPGLLPASLMFVCIFFKH